jgi:ABC-type nitrate/sulfonate/bicarbonate transport system permease component
MDCACPMLNRRPHMISVSGARFQTDAVMVGIIIIIAGTGVAMTQLLRAIERRFARWRPSVGG